MLPSYFWTLMSSAFRAFAPSGELAGSWECVHCGFAMKGRVEGGTSSFNCELQIVSCPEKSLHCKHVLVLTSGEKRLISCEPLPSDADVSQGFGETVTTSFSQKKHVSAHCSDTKERPHYAKQADGNFAKIPCWGWVFSGGLCEECGSGWRDV